MMKTSNLPRTLRQWKTQQRFHTEDTKVRGSFILSYQCHQMEVYLTIIDVGSTEGALDWGFFFLDTRNNLSAVLIS